MTAFKVGQAVLVFDSKKAEGFGEYSYKTVESLIPIPTADPKYMVALVNGLTAAIALDFHGQVKAGDKVLVTAAAGGTGQIAVQWAKAKGAYVIATTSSAEKAKYLKEELGADFVINYREKSIADSLKEHFPKGIDVVWETIGGDVFKTLFENLAPRGRLVIIGSIHSYKTEGAKDVPIKDLNSTVKILPVTHFFYLTNLLVYF